MEILLAHSPKFIEFYSEIFNGDDTRHITLKSHNKETGQKEVGMPHGSFNAEKHLKGLEVLGRSPINRSKGACRWIGLDLDKIIEPKKICSEAYKIDRLIEPFGSTNGKWHLYKFFDDWIPIQEAIDERTRLLNKFKELGYDFDEAKCIPNALPPEYLPDKKPPGNQLFLPRFNGKSYPYDPRGNILNPDKFEFKFRYRHHPLIASSVGYPKGLGNRADILFAIGLYLKFVKIDGLTLEDVNNHFQSPMPQKEVDHVRNDSVPKQCYDLTHLVNNYKDYTKLTSGIEQGLSKGINDVLFNDPGKNDILKKYKAPIDEGVLLEFFTNIIYIKKDDRYFDKKTNDIYKKEAINQTYQSSFTPKELPSKEFAKNKNRFVVESRIYRPDLYKAKNPIFIDPKTKLLHINSYQPGGVNPMGPKDLPEGTYDYLLGLFLHLINYIWADEGERENALDFFSTIFQQPGRKIRTCPLVYSEQKQIGKSSVFKTVQDGLGTDNCSIITPQQALDKGKGFLVDKQLVLIDELKVSGSKSERTAVMNILKPLMTEEEHWVRPLFQDYRVVFTTTSFVAFTNIRDAIAVDDKEERYTITQVEGERLDDSFYKDYWNEKKTGSLSNVVKHFFLNRKIRTWDDLTQKEKDDKQRTFNPEGTCLKTEAFYKMIEEGMGDLLVQVKKGINQSLDPFFNDIISSDEALRYLKDEKLIDGNTRGNEFAEALEKYGAVCLGECHHKHSKRSPTLWSIRNKEHYKKMTNTDVATNYWIPLNPEKWGLTLENNGPQTLGIIQFNIDKLHKDKEDEVPF